MSKEKSYHYYLVCGSLMCANDEEQISTITLNGVLRNDTKDINVRALAKAQQVLQMNFHERMKGELINVVDVVIINISYLGFMTKSKFEEVPEGFELPSDSKTSASAVDANNPFADQVLESILPDQECLPL